MNLEALVQPRKRSREEKESEELAGKTQRALGKETAPLNEEERRKRALDQRRKEERDKEDAHEANEHLEWAVAEFCKSVSTKLQKEKELKKTQEDVARLEDELNKAKKAQRTVTAELEGAESEVDRDWRSWEAADRALDLYCKHKVETLTHLKPEQEPQGSAWPATVQQKAIRHRIWHVCDYCQRRRIADNEKAQQYLREHPEVPQ